MREIKAGEFKAKCLKLMDEVAATGEPLIVTKRGRPIVRLEPVAEEKTISIFEALKGSMSYDGDPDDLIAPLDLEWDYLKGGIDPPARPPERSRAKRRA